MTVVKLFWKDPYQISLHTTVASVSGTDVTLKQTIFYTFAGGQERDTGFIGGYEVLESRSDGFEIIYTLSEDHKLKEGDVVTVKIDWARRYRLMRLHFAAEIILELTYQNYGPIEKIGAHIFEDKSRIDFAREESIKPVLPNLLAMAQELIAADHPITSAFSDEATQRRYWEIEDFAKVACGGTHLKRTGEVGSLRLKRKNIGKGKERIEIYLLE